MTQVTGREHWATKKTPDGDVRLFLWEKFVGTPDGKPAVLFVHGSSMASQPTFDLTVPGRADSSVMDWFAERGFVCWCVDMEGYGRSDKHRDIFCDIANGADDLQAATDHIHARRAACAASSPTASRRARCAPRCSPSVIPSASRAWHWTPSSGPEKARRRWSSGARSCRSSWPASGVRSTASSCARSSSATIPTAPTPATVEAFADAILALDDSMPNGTYIDMCSRLPVVDPQKITVPTLLLRGQFDGIAAMDDLIEFFKRLPSPDKQFTVMNGISHASFQQKNYKMVYHILHAYFTQPAPAYTSERGPK